MSTYQTPTQGRPPIEPDSGAPLGPAPTTWPRVVGIIVVVIASLGIMQYGLCAPIGLLAASLMGSAFESIAESQPNTGLEGTVAQMEALQDYTLVNLASNGAALVLSIMLLIGGIGLLRRRPWARRGLLAWAVLRMIHALPAVYIGYMMHRVQFDAMKDAAASGTAGAGQPPMVILDLASAFGVVGVVIGLVFAWALPVFMLIWLSRWRIRDEMATWTMDDEVR
jgi:hypothetical protein